MSLVRYLEHCQSVQYFAQQFLPRDALHKRGLCRHAVSLSVYVCVIVCVCLPVTFVHCVKTNKDIQFFVVVVFTIG